MTCLPKLPSGGVFTHTNVLFQDSTSSHYDFTAASVVQDVVLFGLPPNHLVTGVKIRLIVEFVNTVTLTAADTMLIVSDVNQLVSVPGSSAAHLANQALDSTLARMSLSPTVDHGSTLPNTTPWFTVTGPGQYAGNRVGNCKPQSFAAHDIVARFISLASVDASYLISGLLAGMVEITVQYCAI